MDNINVNKLIIIKTKNYVKFRNKKIRNQKVINR